MYIFEIEHEPQAWVSFLNTPEVINIELIYINLQGIPSFDDININNLGLLKFFWVSLPAPNGFARCLYSHFPGWHFGCPWASNDDGQTPIIKVRLIMTRIFVVGNSLRQE